MNFINFNNQFLRSSLLLIILVAGGILVIQNPVAASSKFDPGRIIDDKVFYDENSMSSSQIQKFLNSKMPNCDTQGEKMFSSTMTRAEYGESKGNPPPYTCLRDYKQDTPKQGAASSLCEATPGGEMTAAQIINTVAKACGVNPQVLLVLLQKEQSLVTDDWPWKIQYEKATGFACPDTAPCDPSYEGFFHQVYSAAMQYKIYQLNPQDYNYLAGRNNRIYYHPDLNRCGSSTVYIQNQATAGLYNYTPYQPNKASMDAYPGEGNSCSSYGNRNFWFKFREWFGTTQLSFFRIGNDSRVYFNSGDDYYYVPSSDILEAYGGTFSDVVSVNSSYTSDSTYKGALKNIARFGGDAVYLIDGGKKYHFPSREVLGAYGYDVGDEVSLDNTLSPLYRDSGKKMATILRAHSSPRAYLIDNGKKQHISNREAYETLGNPIYAERDSITLSKDFVSSISSDFPIMVEGTLTYSEDGSLNGIWSNGKLTLLSNSLKKHLRLEPDYFARLNELKKAPKSDAPLSRLLQDKSNNFIISSGKKHIIIDENLDDFGFQQSDFAVLHENVASRLLEEIELKKLLQFKGNDEVYSTRGGSLKHIPTRTDFEKLELSWSSIQVVDSGLESLMNKSTSKLFGYGELLRIDGRDEVYFVATNNSLLHIPNRNMFNQYGFAWSSVRNITAPQVSIYQKEDMLNQVINDEHGNMLLIDDNKKRSITEEMASSSVYALGGNISNIMSISIDGYKQDESLTELIRGLKSPKVYKIEDGKKRWITSRERFEDVAPGRWNDVRDLSQSFVDKIPEGSDY